MRSIAGVFLLALLAATSAAQTWTEFRSADGKFSVSMPGKPTESVITVSLGTGDRTANTFSYHDEDLNEFLVAYSERSTPRKSTDEQIFDKARKGLLIATDGKLLRENSVTLAGYTGREIVFERPNGDVQTERFFFVGDRFYQISVEVKKSSTRPVDVERFLSSLRFDG